MQFEELNIVNTKNFGFNNIILDKLKLLVCKQSQLTQHTYILKTKNIKIDYKSMIESEY